MSETDIQDYAELLNLGRELPKGYEIGFDKGRDNPISYLSSYLKGGDSNVLSEDEVTRRAA